MYLHIQLYIYTFAIVLDLPIPEVTIIGDDGPVVGENYTLVCSVIVVDGLADDVMLTVSWTDNNSTQLDSTLGDRIGVTLALEFDPLFSSHGGRYTCDASILVPAVSTVRTNSEPHDIVIQSNNDSV